MKTRLAWILCVGLCACGSTGDDATALDGGSDATTMSDSPFGSGDGGSSDAKPSGDACYAPVDMYIMLDRSCSMGNDCNIDSGTNSKWCHAVNALSGYFNSTSATGNAAALQFFPVTNHTASMCTTGATYDTPASPTTPPPYTTLPTNTFDALLNATTDNNPCITPTEGAIRGLTKFTSNNRRGGRVTIGMLVTDGDPVSCDTNLTDLSNLLQAHYTATTLRTYVIGMTGANDANLEKIAQGGNAPLHPDVVGTLTGACGTSPSPCRHWNVGDGNPQAFIAALAAIQQSADGCADGGGTINPN
ncbi:MAG TPA: hypothetical protein VLM85_03905 [Polyangiaceae bacterium]|nr:hypothetical protein [Polyangiaceae bacterium]